ncbi:MAG: adenylate/guanylate cyclase domain-containing protein, partial [Acidimicrobiales bacterium]
MPACPSCGALSPSGKRFCADCGRPLTAVCPSCGGEIELGRPYCGECGTPLRAPGGKGAPPATATAPGAPAAGSWLTAPAAGDGAKSSAESLSERRVCSILFVDLVGFTPFSEARDPEDVRAMLSRYFEVARTVVSRYGGIVEKFIGDAVVAVWGTPAAAEGDTERAVRAALDLVAAVELLGEELGSAGLAARAGIVTGEVAVHLATSGEGMVAGDAVNTASRVQSVAGGGSVYVDEVTRRLSESAISFEDVGRHELKGKEAPEQLYEAIRVLSGIGGNQRADGLEAPLTGRDGEFRLVKELFHSAVARRAPHLVVVSGPAGVGKSRLGWELEKYIDGLAETVLWHKGRCLSYGEGISFWALAEIVRRRFGIAEEESIEAASSKLAEGLVRFVPDEAERAYVGARLARLLGVGYQDAGRALLSQEELFAGWRIFFERLAAVAPVVMLVEDAQHSDESLLDFFEHLIDWTRDLPIFVLLLARPGLEAIDSGYGVGRNRSTLSLDPLDDGSMSGLVELLVPGMPSGAREAITARAQGIPLFAVETVRSLID